MGKLVDEPTKSVTVTLNEPEVEGAESETDAVRGAASVVAAEEEEGAE